MDADEKLINTRCRVMIREPWYGHMAMGLIWVESSLSWLPAEKRKFCIRISQEGIKILFNPEWVNSRSLEQLFGSIQHILNHLVALHPLRRSGRRLDVWDRACFLPSELISGPQTRQIASLQVGDMVFDRKGSPTIITGVMDRDYDGDLITLKAKYLLPISCTPEHPILAAPWRLRTTTNPKTTIKEYELARFILAGELSGCTSISGTPARSGFALVLPKLELYNTTALDLSSYIIRDVGVKNQSLALNGDLAWVMGLYVAEGSWKTADGNDGIQYSLGSHEIELGEHLAILFSSLGYSPSIDFDGSRQRVSVRSPIIAKAFGEWFGRSAHTKRVPDWLLRTDNKEVFAFFLAGYLEGDGCVAPSSSGDTVRNCGFTVSEVLAKQIQLMAFTWGVPFGISKSKRPERIIDGKVLPPEVGYQLQSDSWQANELFAQATSRRIANHFYDSGPSIYLPLMTVTRSQYCGKVHNIETIDHTYVAGNIVVHNCDMAANGPQSNPRVGYQEEGHKIILPSENLIWIPKDWPEGESAEYFYDRIMKEDPPKEDGGSGPGCCGYDSVDDHESWMETDVSADEARQMISERAKDASEKAVGNVPGHLQQLLDALKKPIVSWREETRQYLGVHVGNRRWTYARANRRNNAFGIKGISHHACAEMVVIVDTSGSISEDELRQFFTEIEAMAARCKVWVLMWDAAFQGVFCYRRGDWKKIKISGCGGTDMRAPVTYLEKHGLIKDVVVMLTDGEVGGVWPEQRAFPMLFCVTGGTTELPNWGKVIRIQVN